MFGNFIYFIVALLIYSTYQPTDKVYFTSIEALGLFVMLSLLFTYFTRMVFRRVEADIRHGGTGRFTHDYGAVVARQSVMAIILFTINLYALNLPSYFEGLQPFEAIPTLKALFFLCVFTGYLAIVWAYAYDVQQRLFSSEQTREEYVGANISFAIPVLLPWLVLSGMADILFALPFKWPKQVLSTIPGEIGYFLFFLLAAAILGPAMIHRFWGCQPLEPGYMRSRIEALCRRANLSYANILYWPIFGGRIITAGVMGLVRHFRYLLVTEGLLRYLEPNEIDAVIAHEIGHIKKKHLLLYLLFLIGYMLLNYAAIPLHRYMFLLLYDYPELLPLLSGALFILSFLLYFRYVFGYFMRNFERQADGYVFSLFDTGMPLVTTLQKISVFSGQPADKPNWHHFSIGERIDFIRRCENNPIWIDRHDRKVRRSLGIYLVGLLILMGAGMYLSNSQLGNRITAHLGLPIAIRMVEANPDKAALHDQLATMYFLLEDFGGAKAAYEHLLTMTPDDPEVLNSLAWLYATSEDPAHRDPERALRLAKRAAELSPLTHILDTLAESYYVNGRYHEAVEVGTEVLRKAEANRSFYRKQLAKFEEAARQTGYHPQ